LPPQGGGLDWPLLARATAAALAAARLITARLLAHDAPVTARPRHPGDFAEQPLLEKPAGYKAGYDLFSARSHRGPLASPQQLASNLRLIGAYR
jgi:hypothetical protein